MYRAAPCLLLTLAFSLATFAAPAPEIKDKEPAKKSPAVEDVKKAIEDLGSKRFVVRDKAKKLLLEAGELAEPFLEEAARSPDEEIASSAKAILERFQWGLYPNTPKALSELIEQFRSGTPEERQQAIGNLLRMKDVPLPTLRKLIAKEENPDLREQLRAHMAQQVREALPGLLARGDYDGAEGIFELLHGAPPSLFGQDYAVFMYLRGKLDAAIAMHEKLRLQKDDAGQRAAEMLVFLYRCKNDWQAARKAAEQANKDDLVERVLWQSFDWKALAAAERPPDVGKYIWVGAAYDRLAGNRKGYDEKIDEIKKAAEDEMQDWVGLRLAANALLLNGKANDAVKILSDKNRELALTFDLLCAQMRHKDAFALVDDAQKGAEVHERNEIRVRRAKMLYMLGDKDAIQEFNSIANEVKGLEDFGLARNLAKAEARFGEDLAKLAMAHTAQSIATLVKAGQRGGLTALFEPLFGDDKDIAQSWWFLFRRELADEKPEVAMKRVRDILKGKLDRKQLDDWLAKMEKKPNEENPRDDVPPLVAARHGRFRSFEAIAAAYRAIGDDKKTEEYLTKAAETSGLTERWIKVGDFLMDKKRYQDAANAFARAARQANEIAGHIEIDDDNFQLLERQNPALPTYLQARAMFLAGDAREGKRLAEIAHWMPLGNDVVRAGLVDDLNKRDWPEMARKEADMLLKTGWWSHYSYGNVLSFLARQAAKDKDYLTAADYYEKCLIGCLRTGASFVEPTAYLLVPESVRVYRARGLLAKGKIDEALREANANLDVMPGNIDLAVKLVPDLDRLGKKKEADAVYEKVRDVWEKLSNDYSGSAYAHNSAAWVMANCRRDLDAALKHAEKAVKLEPKSAGYLDTLAEVNFRKGNRDQALALMKKCTELDAKNAYYRKQLARFKDQPFDSPTPDEGEEEE